MNVCIQRFIFQRDVYKRQIQEYVTKILGFRKSLSLKNALKALKIKVDEGALHDALNDSIYTAHVFKNVYNARAIKKYIVEDIYKMPALEVTSLEGVESVSYTHL